MKLSDLRTNDQVLEDDLRRDLEFRREWERTALARVVANVVVRYRAEHKLSQRAMAAFLGWKQPQVARLELGEHNPTLETLLHIVAKLHLRLRIDINPVGPASELMLVPPTVVDSSEQDGVELRVAAG